MKPKCLIELLALCCLTGCAGYNHTLFMTKSNVGLDFDTKPPTLEVSIARKEAVIAPTFENGQTPPVMASFRPHAGSTGAFKNFFLGVDQTFAGGDAAKAMSVLYAAPTASDPTQFDSAISLSDLPGYTDCFRAIPNGRSTRPIIFGTDTSFGFKAAWSGTGGQVPDTIRLGFNRKEFAWAPITAQPGRQSGKKIVKMPAFLATIESRQDLNSDGKADVGGLQYFATGEAATRLAMQQDVRKSMHGRLDPNSQAFKQKFTVQGASLASGLLFSMETLLDRYDQADDSIARAHKQELQKALRVELPAEYGSNSVPKYVANLTSKQLDKNVGTPVRPGVQNMDAVIQYFSVLEKTRRSLTSALEEISRGNAWTLRESGAVPRQIAARDVVALAADLKATEERAAKLLQQVAAEPRVTAAYDFLQRKLNP
jgi:hypothetical protein